MIRNATGTGRTCLVLSVGGIHGTAPIGAIQALKEKSKKIDCVFCNSREV